MRVKGHTLHGYLSALSHGTTEMAAISDVEPRTLTRFSEQAHARRKGKRCARRDS
jgi:cytosine/adenosine deaminase-related metal-dependent hydrolase